MIEKDRWLLLRAIRGRDEAEAILGRYFHVLPLDQRVKLQLAKAQFEFVIEHILEQNLGKRYGVVLA